MRSIGVSTVKPRPAQFSVSRAGPPRFKGAVSGFKNAPGIVSYFPFLSAASRVFYRKNAFCVNSTLHTHANMQLYSAGIQTLKQGAILTLVWHKLVSKHFIMPTLLFFQYHLTVIIWDKSPLKWPGLFRIKLVLRVRLVYFIVHWRIFANYLSIIASCTCTLI